MLLLLWCIGIGAIMTPDAAAHNAAVRDWACSGSGETFVALFRGQMSPEGLRARYQRCLRCEPGSVCWSCSLEEPSTGRGLKTPRSCVLPPGFSRLAGWAQAPALAHALRKSLGGCLLGQRAGRSDLGLRATRRGEKELWWMGLRLCCGG